MDYRERFELWQTGDFDPETRAELAALTDEKEIEDRFYRDLEFGTGGLRGVMGAGTNRMNRYIIRKASRGLADYLNETGGAQAAHAGVAIAYDTRNHSAEYARETALTLCAAGIRVFLYDAPMPTPVLSFTVRHLGCAAGVVVTASHNPKEYNGYKVYNADGCQLVPHEAEQVIQYVNDVELTAVPVMEEAAAREAGLLTTIGGEVLASFLDAVALQAHPLSGAEKAALRVVYTPLHGTGNLPVRSILSRQGFSDVQVVPAQEQPDGDFSTVRSPNPEDRAALELGIAQAERSGADIVLGTDPDCDRVGVAVRHDGGYRLLTGNQIGALLSDYVLKRRKDTLDGESTLVKTIVTSELGAEIARAHGLRVVDTLTGFKFIGEQIGLYERTGKGRFVLGYEESYGYLVGTHARDKDAVVASMLICEMAAWHKANGRTLLDALEGIYRTYGYYLDALDSFTLKGKEGAARIREIMADLRQQGAGLDEAVASVADYSQGVDGLPKSDVLKFRLKDGSWFAVRPSGTEPKIKVYYSIRQNDQTAAEQALTVWRGRLKQLMGV